MFVAGRGDGSIFRFITCSRGSFWHKWTWLKRPHASCSAIRQPMAQAWYAFREALEQVVAGTAQSPPDAERTMWSAFDVHRHCYMEYSASLLPSLSAVTDVPRMTAPLRKYYVYRRKLHTFLVGSGDDMSLLDVRMAREQHECAYREYLKENGRSTCGWIRTLANKLQCPRMRTLRLISEYPDTHQLAAACERVDGMVTCLSVSGNCYAWTPCVLKMYG